MKDANILLAVFIGMTYEKNLGWYDNDEAMFQRVYDGDQSNCFDDLLFDKDWNWLMSVVDKIEEDENIDVLILQNGTQIIDYRAGGKVYVNNCAEISFENKIEHVYSAVVEFIKWYNENKTK